MTRYAIYTSHLVVAFPKPKLCAGALVTCAPYGGALKPNDKLGVEAATVGTALAAAGVPKLNAVNKKTKIEKISFV